MALAPVHQVRLMKYLDLVNGYSFIHNRALSSLALVFEDPVCVVFIDICQRSPQCFNVVMTQVRDQAA